MASSHARHLLSLGLVLSSAIFASPTTAPDIHHNESTPHDLAHLPVYVISMLGSTRRPQFTQLANQAGLTNITFVDAVNARDMGTMAKWLGTRTFDHLKCDVWKYVATKKIAVWASQMAAYRLAAQNPGPSLVVEDDVNLAPRPLAFNRKTFLTLKAIDANVLPDNWDVIFMGSCLEDFRGVRACHCLRSGTYLARGNKPNCAHGLLFSNAGAKHFLQLLGNWSDVYYEAVQAVQAPNNCANATRIETTGKEKVQVPVHGDNIWDFWTVYSGQDTTIRDKITEGRVNAFHVWPQLVTQRGREEDPDFSYSNRIPHACKLAERATRRARHARQALDDIVLHDGMSRRLRR